MCWITSVQESGEPKAAQKDISVYKVCLAACGSRPGEKTAQSYFRAHAYRAGCTYKASGFSEHCETTGMSHQENVKYGRYGGFHSYSPECAFARILPVGVGREFMYAVFPPGETPSTKAFRMNEWYGRYTRGELGKLTGKEDVLLAECVIPEGALYCVNERGEYVSDALRVDAILTPEEWAERHSAANG